MAQPRFISVLIFFCVFSLEAQNKGSFGLILEVAKQNFSMVEINTFFNDPIINTVEDYELGFQESTLSEGLRMGAVLTYQPSNFFDVGLYADYQYSTLDRYPKVYYYFPNIITGNDDTVQNNGHLSVKSSVFGIGFTGNIYFNKLLSWDQKSSFLAKRLVVGLEVKVGGGLSNLLGISTWSFGNLEQTRIDHEAIGFQSQVALNFGFKITESPISSFIGLKLGYQYFRTGTLMDAEGSSVILPFTGNLAFATTLKQDYSGLFASIYLKIGR